MTSTQTKADPTGADRTTADRTGADRDGANRTSSGQRPTDRNGVGRRPGGDTVLVATTATVAGGMLLTTLPLSSIFTDWGWLNVSIGCGLPYLVIVAALRYLGPARWWHSVIGLVASLLTVLWVFVPQHLWYGIVPTADTARDVDALVQQARDAMQAEHAPVHTTLALRLLVAAALVGLLCLTDVLGVLLRRPLLAAAPLLEVLAVASATSSKSANPFWFAAAAVGFLLILLAGTRLQDRVWGPSVDGSAGRLGGGRRMAVTGIVAALVVPLLLPSVPSNLLARAAHHNGIGDGNGNGGGQVLLNGLASLRGSLRRSNPASLFQVQVNPGDAPFYVRQIIDDEYTSNGWRPSGNKFTEPTNIPLGDGRYPSDPNPGDATPGPAFDMRAQFRILLLVGDTLPILSNPTRIANVLPGTWNSHTSSVLGVSLKKGMSYSEVLKQPAPTVAQLRAAPAWQGSDDKKLNDQLLQLPSDLPASVRQLAAQITSGQDSPYDKALAISQYFTDQKNGFSYSLNVLPDDGNGALVSFLDQKQGFCQQYAAAAAVLMRSVGLPTRVVIGYTHKTPDSNGSFIVTTSDAHAWVEVFFQGIGWIPFDPTPFTATDSLRAFSLPWAPHPAPSDQSTAEPTANKGPSALAPGGSTSAVGGSGGGSGQLVPTLVWQVGAVLVVLLLVLAAVLLGPRAVRRRQRRRRLDRARTTGNPEPLWLELAASAADRNALWPDTLTVGQVAGWLGRHGVDEPGRAAVATVADTVARDRFSAQPVSQLPPGSVTELDRALTRWARRTDRRLSLLHRWLPRSLVNRQPRWHR
jgi:transglutaminase-like putative cysteine protease